MTNLRSGRRPNLQTRQTPIETPSNPGQGQKERRRPGRPRKNAETTKGPSKKRQRTSDTSTEEENLEDEPSFIPNPNALSPPNQDTGNGSTEQQITISTSAFDEESDLPNLSNYDSETTKMSWPPTRCKAKLAEGFRTKASIDGIEEIRNLCRQWEHLKMLMALALRCSLRTVNKHIGTVREKRERSAYINFLEFSIVALEEAMPSPDDPHVAEKFSQHNKTNGERWTQLTPDEKDVFTRKNLLALAGIPDLAADEVESGSESQGEGDSEVPIPKVTPLSAEDEARYRPIYDKLVDHSKVVSRLGPAVPGVSDALFTRRSFRCVQKHSRDLIADSRQKQFDFWLIAASAVPPLSPSTPSWVKVYTTLPVLTKFLTSKANFPAIFGAVAQGTSVIKAVAGASGNNNIGKVGRKNVSDEEKVKFGNTLVSMLTKLIGIKPAKGMPRGRNPQDVLSKREPPIRMVLEPRARLKMSDLDIGFSQMGVERRRAWQKDCRDGLFHFERKSGDHWVGINEKKIIKDKVGSEEEDESDDEDDETEEEDGEDDGDFGDESEGESNGRGKESDGDEDGSSKDVSAEE